MSEEIRHEIVQSQLKLGDRADGWIYTITGVCACGEKLVTTVWPNSESAQAIEARLAAALTAHRQERKEAEREAREARKKESSVVAEMVKSMKD